MNEFAIAVSVILYTVCLGPLLSSFLLASAIPPSRTALHSRISIAVVTIIGGPAIWMLWIGATIGDLYFEMSKKNQG